MRALLLLTCVFLGTGCINVSWIRNSRFTPPADEGVAELQPDESELAHCLATLGAPLWVWEYRGEGLALAYGWLETNGMRVNVSVPVSEFASASFDYSDVESEMQGLVLLLDENLVLRELRRGLLRDLTRGAGRVRPAAPTD